MSYIDGVLSGDCTNCHNRPAKIWWTGHEGVVGAIHGMAAPWCRICVLEKQIEHAKERAAAIPNMEKQLKELLDESLTRIFECGYCDNEFYAILANKVTCPKCGNVFHDGV